MKRRKVLKGFIRHQSKERLAKIERDWKYLPPYQQLRFTLIILWHSAPTLYQIINHIKYFWLRWITARIFPAHWVK